MPILIFFIFWYALYGKNNPKIYRKIQPKLGIIVIVLFLLSGLSSWLPILLILTVLAVVFGLPIGIAIMIIRRLTGGKKQKKSDYTYYQQHYSQPEKKKGTTVTGLTRTVQKRIKIVQKFNQKYDLTLTEEEINCIVDASYMSNCWEREIYDMDIKYETVSEWYRTDSAWLRAYLRVFPVQNVTSDFENQKRICLDAFYQIFSEVDPGKYVSVADCVNEMNKRFMTSFDEITFSIAHRFLQGQGYSFSLPHYDVRGTKSDIENLQEKYDRESTVDSETYEKMRQW